MLLHFSIYVRCFARIGNCSKAIHRHSYDWSRAGPNESLASHTSCLAQAARRNGYLTIAYMRASKRSRDHSTSLHSLPVLFAHPIYHFSVRPPTFSSRPVEGDILFVNVFTIEQNLISRQRLWAVGSSVLCGRAGLACKI